MAATKPKIPLRSLLVLCYLIVFMSLTAWLVYENRYDEAFSLSRASAEEKSNATTLSLYGDNFHPGIRGVLTQSLINEKALLWHRLVAVPTRAIDVKGGLALVASYGNKLISIDLQKSAGSKFLDSIELPDTIKHIQIIGDQVLVGMRRHAGLLLVNMKDPKALKAGKHFPVDGFVSSMVVDRSYVYFTDIFAGIGRIDLAAKTPTLEKMVSLESPWDIALQGKKLVVGTLKGRVHCFDISATGQLVEVGTLDYPVHVRGVVLTENVLAVALVDGTLHVFNLSSWPNLSDPVQLKLPGRPWQLRRVPGQSSLVVSLAAGGLGLIEVSRPESPTFVGHLKLPSNFVEMALQSETVYGVSHNGLEAFSLDEIKTGELSRLATAATIEQVSYQLRSWNNHIYGYNNMTLVDFGASSGAMAVTSQFLAVADRDAVSLFEKREDGKIKRSGSLLLAEGSVDARFRDNYLYVIHSAGLRIFSTARPETLTTISELPLSGQLTRFEILDSGYLLVATRDKGLLVVDVSDPQQPVQVSSLVLPRHLQRNVTGQDILINGQRAYISQGKGGVHVVDISVPSQPELLQIIETPGYAKKMVLFDDLLLVADDVEGVFMIDISNFNKALPIGSLLTPLRIAQIAVAEEGLIVSSHPGGTMKLPLPQRLQNLQVVGKDEMKVDVESVERGQHVYLYDERTSAQVAVGSQ